MNMGREEIKLKVKLKNCFGIGELEEEFNFSDTNIYLFYAQNGICKTSFAKTFKSKIRNQEIKDKIYLSRIANADILFNGENISSNNTLVFESYDENFSSEESVTTFMASSELKKEYDTIFSELDKKKKMLVKNIKSDTGSSDCEKEILEIFSSNNFYEVLSKNLEEIKNIDENYNFDYHAVFDDKGKVKEFLDKNQNLLQEYFEKYKEILSQSNIFKNTDKGEFGTHKIKELENVLKDERFFSANHKLLMNNQEIKTSDEFKELIKCEMERILNDEELKQRFDNIEKQIKNQELKNFKEIIQKNNELLIKLTDYGNFKKEVMLSYLNKRIQEVDGLVNDYTKHKPKIQSIIAQAKDEQEKWKNIIEMFNSRFLVPFRVGIKNQEDVLLKKDIAEFSFKFKDLEDEEKMVKKDDLQRVLSTGEKRALYILQILFEIEAKKVSNEKTLLIFDDIADSFDYRNKYAIIEYINDLKESNLFKIIVMTHNFDFYRTLANRLSISRDSIKMIHKDKHRKISFENGQYIKDFIESINKDISNEEKFIALIPFTRNIIEYTKGSEDNDYQKLTSCLHIKNNTKNIKAEEVNEIFKKIYSINKEFKDNTRSILDLIYSTCEKIIKEENKDYIKLENKIVLSIGVRFKAEEFMISKRDSQEEICKNQTRKLFNQVKDKLSNKEIEIINKTLMITPENIHINSFMYEPILDTSLEHLIRLYEEIKENLVLNSF